MLYGCGSKHTETTARSVMLTTLTPVGASEVKSFSGIIRETNDISLGFKVPGQISHIYVKEGDYVRKGQLVAVLDDVDYKLAVSASEIQCKQLSDEVTRLKSLYEGKSVSANDYEKAVAGLRQVEIQLQSNRNQLKYTSLYSPVDGYVRSVNFAQAEMVDAGTSVVSVLDVQKMKVEVNIPAELYSRREAIGDIYCCLASDKKENFKMNIINIVPKADGVQLYKMQLAFDGKISDKKLTSGMNVEVRMQVNSTLSAGEFSLPTHSIFQDNGETYVWVLDEKSEVHKCKVSVVGLDKDGNAIVAGLKGTEQIVKAGVSSLNEGEKVNVIEQPSETNKGGLI